MRTKKIFVIVILCILVYGTHAMHMAARHNNMRARQTEQISGKEQEDNTTTDIAQTDTEKFIKDYEDFNLQRYDEDGKNLSYRYLTLNQKANIVYISYADAIAKLENNERFSVYYGWPDCPYCRGIIEPLLNAAASTGETLYVIEIPDNDARKSRSIYKYEDGKVVKTHTNINYERFLSAFGEELFQNYIVYRDDNDDVGIDTGKKRMVAPTLLHAEKGKGSKFSAEEWDNSKNKGTEKANINILHIRKSRHIFVAERKAIPN